MQVRWETVEAIASTKAIDLWYLFPMGVGVNRLLRRDGHVAEPLSRRLDALFGTHDWQDAFYRRSTARGLFGEDSEVSKDADFGRIAAFVLDRLRSIFPGVADNALVLRNSRNSPLYLFCFAAGNPDAAKVTVRIAQDVLKE